MKRAVFLLFAILTAAPSWAALSINVLTGAADASNLSTPYTTASVTLTANRPAFLCVVNRLAAGDPETPVVAGFSATWVQIGTSLTVDAAGTSTTEVHLFRTMVTSDQTGTVTIDHTGAHSATSWSLVEFIGADTSGTNGSGAVVQTAQSALGAPATAFSQTLAAFGNANNRPYLCAAGLIGTDQDFVPDGTGVQIHDLTTGEGDQLFSMWDLTTADITPSLTWTTSDQDFGGIAVEVKAAVANRRTGAIVLP